jgi:hypothetical protein
VTPFHLLPEVLSDVDFAPAKAIKPSSQWSNWWKVCVTNGDPPVGHVYRDMDIWPTLEVCEEKAREEIEWDIAEAGQVIDEWMGAYPVEGDA